MLRSLRLATRRRHDAAGDESGFSLIEVIVALGLLMIVMLSTAGFFTSSLKQTSGQAQSQEAVQLATQQLEYTRSVPATSLLAGRTAAQVTAANTSALGLANLTNDFTATTDSSGLPTNYDASAISTSSQAIPITSHWIVSGVNYTGTTFVNRCYVTYVTTSSGPPGCYGVVNTANGYIYRITVAVTWNLSGGRSCPTASKACQYVVSTLRDPGGVDPCFNVRNDTVGCSTTQPTINTNGFSPATVNTGTTTTVTMSGSNYVTGATVSIDSGGTVSNVVVAGDGNSLTFSLAADNSAAAIGTHTITLLNPDGTTVQGTMSIAATAITVTGLSPSSGAYGATKTYTINGTGFDPNATETVDGAAVAGSVAWNSATKETMVFTNYPAVGSHTFVITNPDGNNATGTFTMTVGSITVTSVTPATGGYGTNKTFVINGTGFVSGATVTMDATTLPGTATYNAANKITVVLSGYPAVGTHLFTVTNPDSGSAGGSVTITSAAVNISSITSTSFVYNATKTFVLNGTGFVSGAVIKMDGAALVGTATYNSSTKVTVVLTNAPAVGSHTFTLTNPDTGSDTEPFTITSATTGTITSVTPASPTGIPSNSGAVTITVNGTGFVTGTGTITLNGTPTGNTDYSIAMTASSSTKATFVVPAGSLPSAGTYAITVNLNYSNGTISPDFVWQLKTT